jgi:hypothetical protein
MQVQVAGRFQCFRATDTLTGGSVNLESDLGGESEPTSRQVTAILVFAAAGATAVLVGLVLEVIAVADEAQRTVIVVKPSETDFPTAIWTPQSVTMPALSPTTTHAPSVAKPSTSAAEAAPAPSSALKLKPPTSDPAAPGPFPTPFPEP